MNYQMTELAKRAEARCQGRFEEIDRIAFACTEKGTYAECEFPV